MLGTDFAVFSLIDRALQPVNRISLWHYSFVPLTACSVVPIIVGCCLSRLKYMVRFVSLARRLDYGDLRVADRSLERSTTSRVALRSRSPPA